MRLLDRRPKQSQKSGDKSSADTHGECANLIHNQNGEVSERFKEHAWKACVGETQPWVRIPPSPPQFRLWFHLVNRPLRDVYLI
jgi:hypothetical protein